MHVSDVHQNGSLLGDVAKYRNAMRFVFRVPPVKHMATLRPLMDMAIGLIDVVSGSSVVGFCFALGSILMSVCCTMYVCMYVCMYGVMYVRMYVCMYLCMYVCMHVWMSD
jgi:hypothetical protein